MKNRLYSATLILITALALVSRSHAMVVFSEDFDPPVNPANAAATTGEWYLPETGNNAENEESSVTSLNGGLRIGFGYDVISVRYISPDVLVDISGGTDYLFSLDIDLDTQLDNDFGFAAIFGTDDATGSGFVNIQQMSFGRADDTEAGFTNVGFTITGDTIATAAGITEGNNDLLAIRFYHNSNGGGADRNDVWVIDNVEIVAIPEPSTLNLLLLSIVGGLVFRKRLMSR